MFRKSLLLACAAVLFAPVAARAQTPEDNGGLGKTEEGVLSLSSSVTEPNYFHRAGATLADHDAFLAACQSLAVAMDEPGAPTYNSSTTAMAVAQGGLIGLLTVAAIEEGRAESAAESREPMARAANVENCMVSYGWDVRGVDEAAGAWLLSLPVEELRPEMATRVGAENPSDPLLRRYGNELGMSGGVSFGLAGGAADSSLSLAIQPYPERGGNGARQNYMEARRIGAGYVRLRREEAIVGVRVKPDPVNGGRQLRFVRLNAEGTRPAADREPNTFTVDVPRVGDPAGVVTYYEAPAGVWRLAEVVDDRAVLSLCLAAPQFSVTAGEAVYAGTYDTRASLWPLSAERGGVAQDMVRDIPMRAAEYSQGEQVRCAGAYLYALREPQAFEEPVLEASSEAQQSAAPAEPAVETIAEVTTEGSAGT